MSHDMLFPGMLPTVMADSRAPGGPVYVRVLLVTLPTTWVRIREI